MKWKSNLNKPVTWNILIKFIIVFNVVILASILQFEYAYVQVLEEEKHFLEERVNLQTRLIQFYQEKVGEENEESIEYVYVRTEGPFDRLNVRSTPSE